MSAAETRKANAEARRQKEEERRKIREEIKFTCRTILEDETTTKAEKLEAAKLLNTLMMVEGAW